MSKKKDEATVEPKPATEMQRAEIALRDAESACYTLYDREQDEYTQRALEQTRAALKSLRKGR